MTRLLPLLVVTSACAPTPSYASYGGYQDLETEPELPAAELVVRPDAMSISFALESDDPDLLEKSVAAIDARLRVAADTEVQLRLRGFSPGVGKGKLAAPASNRWIVRGTVTVPLTAESTFWQRVGLASSLRTAIAGLERTFEDNANINVVVDGPRVLVRDPEWFREQLISRWLTRARELATAAQVSAAPLVLLDCVPPGVVNQSAHSFEEVHLTLELSCRIDVAGRQTPEM